MCVSSLQEHPCLSCAHPSRWARPRAVFSWLCSSRHAVLEGDPPARELRRRQSQPGRGAAAARTCAMASKPCILTYGSIWLAGEQGLSPAESAGPPDGQPSAGCTGSQGCGPSFAGVPSLDALVTRCCYCTAPPTWRSTRTALIPGKNSAESAAFDILDAHGWCLVG